jgi:PTS system mannose-specific IIC component
MGFFWAMFTGEYAMGLGVSLFFELLWLDLFPAGTYIPPNGQAPTLACLAGLHHFDLTQPSVAVLAMILALPLGRIFAKMEGYHRQYENVAFNNLLLWAREPSSAPSPSSMVTRSILLMVSINFVAFSLALLCMLVLLYLALPHALGYLRAIPTNWSHLWMVASLGAVLSLRHRPAYALLLAGVILAMLARMFI